MHDCGVLYYRSSCTETHNSWNNSSWPWMRSLSFPHVQNLTAFGITYLRHSGALYYFSITESHNLQNYSPWPWWRSSQFPHVQNPITSDQTLELTFQVFSVLQDSFLTLLLQISSHISVFLKQKFILFIIFLIFRSQSIGFFFQK